MGGQPGHRECSVVLDVCSVLSQLDHIVHRLRRRSLLIEACISRRRATVVQHLRKPLSASQMV